MIGTEGLDAVDVLHDAADRLGTDLMLGHAVFGNNTEGTATDWDQPATPRKESAPPADTPCIQSLPAWQPAQRFGDVRRWVGQDLLVAAHIAGHGIHILPPVPG